MIRAQDNKRVKAKLVSILCLVSGTYKSMFNKIDYRKPESCFSRDPKKEGIPITRGLYYKTFYGINLLIFVIS
jgi:hypothetical protein